MDLNQEHTQSETNSDAKENVGDKADLTGNQTSIDELNLTKENNLPDLNKDINIDENKENKEKKNLNEFKECPLTDSKSDSNEAQSGSFKQEKEPNILNEQIEASLKTNLNKLSQTNSDSKSSDDQLNLLNFLCQTDQYKNDDNFDIVDARTSKEFENKKASSSKHDGDKSDDSKHDNKTFPDKHATKQDKLSSFNMDELSGKLLDLSLAAEAEEDQNENLPDLIKGDSNNRRKQTDERRSNEENQPIEKEPPAYSIKWIKFRNKQCAIITQNENGCCPLLAIMNVLLLRGKITIPLSTKLITYDQMIVFLANLILENGTNNAPEQFQLDYEQVSIQNKKAND